jgi:non-specific serine/threonine protein kinase/serine/threonine-protein kinase
VTSERWDQIKSVYQEASEQPTESREQFLRERCAGDEELFAEVYSLLDWGERAEQMFSKPVAEIPPLLAPQEIPERIGAWRVLREIGRGGMGTVYLACRDDGLFDQKVAVKLIHLGGRSHALVQRFNIERRILASLDHPHIARILDGGTLISGDPYLVMEYVEGESLDAWCRRRQSSIHEKLRLFLQVCDAVRYAHRNLIVHRDLKPANIVVNLGGVPKLLDFGVAKLLDAGSTDNAVTTDLLMTPAYASPEQVRGDPAMVASDIYSLGVILFELLSGQRPYSVRTISPVALARTICETDPPLPSSVAPPEQRKAIAGDLDNITMLALRKDPERRYASVEAMSADIHNHLEGRPVTARRDSVVYRATKFLLRHRIAVSLGAAAALAVIAGVVAAFWQAHIARQRAEDGHKLARTVLFEIYDSVERLPGATATKDLVAKRAVEYLDKLARGAQGDIDLQRDLANGYMRVAEVEGASGSANLGHASDAIANYRKAIDLLERIVRRSPSDVPALDSLSLAYISLSQEITSVNDSLTLAGKGLALAKDGLARSPQDGVARRTLAQANYGMARALTNLDRRKDALPYYADALSTYRDLSSADPSNREFKRAVALVHKRMGAILWVLGRYPEAVTAYREAGAVDEQLVESAPSDMRAKIDLSYDYSDLGNLLNFLGDSHGIQTMNRALALRREAFAADRQDARARFSLVSLLHRVAHVEHGSGEVKTALEHVSEAHALMVQFGVNRLDGDKSMELAAVEQEWGEILASQHACAEAQSHMTAAHKLLKDTEARNLPAQRDLMQEIEKSMKPCT